MIFGVSGKGRGAHYLQNQERTKEIKEIKNHYFFNVGALKKLNAERKMNVGWQRSKIETQLTFLNQTFKALTFAITVYYNTKLEVMEELSPMIEKKKTHVAT